MTSYWSLSLTDDDLMGEQAARANGLLPPEPPQAPFPETMAALNIDAWEPVGPLGSGPLPYTQPLTGGTATAVAAPAPQYTPLPPPAPVYQPPPPTYTAPATGTTASAEVVANPYQQLTRTTPQYTQPMVEPDRRSPLEKAASLLKDFAPPTSALMQNPATALIPGVAALEPVITQPTKPLVPAADPYVGGAYNALNDAIAKGFNPGAALGGTALGPLAQSAYNVLPQRTREAVGTQIAPWVNPLPADTSPLQLATTLPDLFTYGAGIAGVKAAGNLAQEGAERYVANAARAGLGAVPEGAVRRTVADAAPLRSAPIATRLDENLTGALTGWPADVTLFRGDSDNWIQKFANPETGTFYTPRLDVAEGYAGPRQTFPTENWPVGARLTKEEGSFRNPLVIDRALTRDIDGQHAAAAVLGIRGAGDLPNHELEPLIARAARQRGYDAVIYQNAGEIQDLRNGVPATPSAVASNIPRGISPTEGEGIMRTAGAAEKAPTPRTSVPEASPAGLTDAAAAPPSGGPPSGAGAGGAGFYHETNDTIAMQMLGNGTVEANLGGQRIYVSDVPELALGQGGHGALVEFDPAQVKARQTPKIGQSPASIAAGTEYVTDSVGPNAVRSVTFKAPDRVTMGGLRTLEQSGDVTLVRNADGSITATRTPKLIDYTTPKEPPSPPRSAPPSAPGGEGPGFAANIRLSKYPEEVRAPIKEWADANPDQVQAARRGLQSDEMVREAARQLADDVGADFSKLQKKWKPGDAWNAEEIVAIRGVLNDRTQAVLDAAKAARTGDIEAQAKLMLAIEEQAKVQEIVHGVTAEAGRALRSFRQETLESLANQDIARLRQLLGRAVSDGTLQDVANDLAKLDLDDPVALNKYIRGLQKPDAWDYIHELWINSVLSGPKTHIVNIVSNAMATAISPIERGLAAAADIPISKIQGRPRARFFSEVQADAFGSASAIPEAWDTMLKVMRGGLSPSSATKLESHVQAFKGPLGTVIRSPGTALEMMDSFFYTLNYRAALNANIMRKAQSEGLKGAALVDRVADLKLNPTYDLIKGARNAAEYRVFRQDSKLANKLMGLRETSPAFKLFVPFVRTPTNVVKFGLERSPLGILDPTATGPIRALIKKDPDAADKFARLALGSLIAGAAAWQFGEGKITGAAPKNAAERDRFFREGRVPFAVNIGGKWVQFQRIEPFNQPLTQLAGAVDAIKNNDASATQQVMGVVTAMANNLTNQTFLTGISDLLDAVMKEDANVERTLTRTAAGFMPFSSLSRTATQLSDTTVRDPEGLVETFKAQIPGLSEQVPARLTAFGEDAKRQSPAWSPYQVTSAKQSDVDRVLEELGVEIGFVRDTIGKRKLNREDQHLYQQVAGQLVYMDLVDLIASNAWQAADNVEKQALLDRTVDSARDDVREALAALLDKRDGVAP